ncbi:solute-binding protein [Metallosphaera tengchongensis]|uniref:Solute-binding protein n=1 Tax=Metallosphaera tengchongensis TaxID=1532350 RepID=A0A6N0NUJ9_9CREN|nr:extracellular solute-binding protein [Metallosphaera tengchongensis]QKQ99418.1 solute-binding protein [Metallosphaera tengchongensis]
MNKGLIIGIVVLIIIIVGVLAYVEVGMSHHVSPSKTTTNTTTSTPPTTSSTPLYIWVADAYTAEAQFLGSSYQNSTGISVPTPKGGGSFGLAREIASEGSNAQVTVFLPVALSAASSQYLGNYSSGWAIAFVADQLTIAYTNSSINNQYAKEALAYAKQAEAGNTSAWYDFFNVLSSGKVKVGISDPNTDPAGFRAWITLELAGYEYANNTFLFYNDMLKNSGNVTAANAAELVSPLEAGQINFLFIYKSAAIAKGLQYVQLPPQVNQGDPKYASLYSEFEYNLSTGPVKGSPIYLFITVPKNTNNPTEALNFVVYVVENSQALSKFGLLPLSPAILFNSTAVPQQIASLLAQGKLVEGGPI